MSSLFPNFKTFLFQGKGVTGEVPFIKFDTDLKGLYLPATFTRPNSAEDPTESGATVIDADGSIRKLNEDEAPWSYPIGGSVNGCLRLLNLPEAKNEISDNTTPANWYNNVLTPTNEGNFELNGNTNFQWGKYTQSGTVNNFGFKYSGFSAGEDYAISVYVKLSESGDYLGLREAGNGVGIVQISTESIITSAAGLTSVKVLDTADADIKRVVLLGTSGNGGTFFFVLPSSTGSIFTDDGNTIQITAFQVEKSRFETNVIPVSGTSLTRNSSQSIFTDLVNKGVTSAGGFSLFFDFDEYKNGGTDGDNTVLFKDNGGDVMALFGLSSGLTVRDKTNNSYLDQTKKADSKLILTFDGQRVKYYYSGAKQIDGLLSTGGHVIDEIIFNSADNFYNIYAGSGIAPYVLPEATAAALTA
jgi:hypothetical protein